MSPSSIATRPSDPECTLRAGAVSVDLDQRVATYKGQSLALTPRELALLACLLRERNRVMTRRALFERLYADQSEASDKVIEVLMSTLRAKLSRVGARELIETRRGMGYVIPG